MADAGFLEQKQRAHPLSLGVVLLLHGAAIGALMLAKGPEILEKAPPLIVKFIPTPLEPAPEPPPPQRAHPEPRQAPSRIDRFPPVVDRVPANPVSVAPLAPLPDYGIDRPGPALQPEPARPVEPAPPVRVDAAIDPRFAGDLQPPYPAAEERAEREGSVRLRITIGSDGRVTSAERIEATSDAFWRVTQRHALSRWRFRPATVDGRPVESRKVMTVVFQLPR